MSSSPFKLPPQRAESSIGDPDLPEVDFAYSADHVLKQRFKVACARWTTLRDATQEHFADAVGEPYWRVKRWLSADTSLRVSPDSVLRAERLVVEAQCPLTDSEIAAKVRDYCRAQAEFEKVRQALMEAAA